MNERFSAQQLADALNARGTPAVALDEVDTIVEQVVVEVRPGDVVLVMSNGDFEGIWEKLLAALHARC